MKLTKEQASQVFSESWEIFKKYGFEKLTDKKWESLMMEEKKLTDKCTGDQNRLMLHVLVGINNYYQEIQHEGT